MRQCGDVPDILAVVVESSDAAVITDDPNFLLIPGQDLHEIGGYMCRQWTGSSYVLLVSAGILSNIVISLELKNLTALDAYEADEPNVFINAIDALPVVWVDSFSQPTQGCIPLEFRRASPRSHISH